MLIMVSAYLPLCCCVRFTRHTLGLWMQCDNYMYQRRRRPSESDYHARILSLCAFISFIPSYRLKPSAQSTASSLVGLRVLDHYLFVQ